MSKRERMRRLLALACGAMLAGCASAQDEPAATNDSAITNAVPTQAYPAVTQLVVNSNYWCTATLVAPQILLTAAHCVHTRNAVIGAWFGSQWYTSDWWRWNNGFADPGSGPTAPVGLERNLDIAVVHLSRPVAGVAPMPLAHRMPRAAEPFAIVGFGEAYAGEGSYRTKREARAVVGDIAGTWFYGSGSSSPCHADSGGPAIAQDGTVLGVFARMYNDCRGGVNGFSYVALDATATWVESYF